MKSWAFRGHGARVGRSFLPPFSFLLCVGLFANLQAGPPIIVGAARKIVTAVPSPTPPTGDAGVVVDRPPVRPSPDPTPAPAPTPEPGTARVLYVSTRGSDANSGGSPDTALRTISAAAGLATPGTTVLIEGGSYFEQVVTKNGGVAGQEIEFRSFNGTAVIDGSTQSWTPAGNQNQGLVELRHPFVRLEGLRIMNSKNTGVLLDADNLTVEGCEVADTQRHGISTHTSRQTNYPGLAGTMIRNTVVRNNLVRRAALSGRGQAVSLIADTFLVAGNEVRDNPREGIDIWLGATHGEVVDNVVHGNAAPGIYVDGASYVRIHRNTVFGNSKGIGVSSEDLNYGTHDIWVYNNVVYDNAGPGCFIWDDRAAPGYKGSQNVLLAHNTLVGNNPSIYLSGEDNTAEIMNNVGYRSGASVYSSAVNSSFHTHDNVWLTSATGFVDPGGRNFRLTSASQALDKGAPVPVFRDNLGNTFTIPADFDGLQRLVNGAPDAGAFEYR